MIFHTFEDLERAEQHVALSERHISRQRELIAELERDGHDTQLAAELLSTLEESQAAHIADRNRLKAELSWRETH
jgi:hypothetical protein